jgi:hypothetical protein
MRRVVVCLGTVLLFGAFAHAQQAAPETLNQNSTPGPAAAPRAAADSGKASPPSTPVANDADKQTAEHHTHVRLGGIGVSAGYAHFSPGFYPYGYPYAPFYPFSGVSMAMLWDPFWGYYPPYYPDGYFASGAGKGELKLTAAAKNATVYLNGAYAGTADHLKSMWLDPGVYDLEVTTSDGGRFEQRVYVLTGKSLKIVAQPAADPKAGKKL